MGVATPKVHQTAKTNKICRCYGEKPARPYGEKACKTSDACWARSKMESWPLGFGPWESSAELPQKTRNIHVRFFCQNPEIFEFFEAKAWTVIDKKKTLWHGLRRIAAECHRIAAECRRIATEFGNPQLQKIQNWPAWLCQKKFKSCPNFLNFCRSKSGAKSGQRGLFSLMANEVGCAISKGNRWSVAMVWDGKSLGRWRWHCSYGNNAVDRKRCKVWGRLRLFSRRMHNCPAAIQSKMQEPAKQNQQNISHVEPWQQKHVSNTWSHAKSVWGHCLDMRQGKEAWFASSAEKGPKATTEQISTVDPFKWPFRESYFPPPSGAPTLSEN